MPITEFFAKDHVDKWIKAWNNHNLKAILSLYSEDIEFHSPKIKIVYPDRTTAVITNKASLTNNTAHVIYCTGKFLSVQLFLK